VTVPNPPSGTTPSAFDTWATTVATDVNANSTAVADLPGTYEAGSQGVRVGWWSSPSGIRGTGTQIVDRIYCHQLVVPDCRVDRIACEVVTAGGSGSVTRLGIYAAAADRLPGTLVVDAGTFDSNALTGVQPLTIDQSLTAGVYWLAIAAQGGTSPTYRVTANAAQMAAGLSSSTGGPFGANGNRSGLFTFGGITGAFPASIAGSISDTLPPSVVSVRFATPL
jgi:hypothetical protein